MPKQVWAFRARLELAGNSRDLALFNLAIDSKLRGCNLVKLRVSDLFIGDRVRERVMIVRSGDPTPSRSLILATLVARLPWPKKP